MKLLLGEFTLQDAPYPLFEAIRTGMDFLSFDEWMPEDRPPKSIWLDADKLKSHISEIKRRRKAGEQPGGEDDEPMEQNSLVRDLVVG